MPTLLLLTPPYHCGVVEVAGRWVPLNLLYLAAAARRAGWEVELFDAMSRFEGPEEIRAAVSRARPDVVGIPAITATMPAVHETAALVKATAPEAKVVVGGVHPTFMAE